MAILSNGSAHAAHVNMMTDTIIANLPADGLRVVIRSLLAARPEVTSIFEDETRKYLEQNTNISPSTTDKIDKADIDSLKRTQQIIRCMLGSGLPFQSIPLLSQVLVRAALLATEAGGVNANSRAAFVTSVDGDIVQAVTAVQKSLFVQQGIRALFDDEKSLVQNLYDSIEASHCFFYDRGAECPYGRGLTATASILGVPQPSFAFNGENTGASEKTSSPPPVLKETFTIKDRTLPRIFSGLWQMSSPAWGSAPTSKIVQQFSNHVQSGFTAFDMADHYGDAEIIFGSFQSQYSHKDMLFTATKYCLFHPVTITQDVVRQNVTERCTRLRMEKIDLLQFHWQFYEDPQYLDALRYLAEDERVSMIGLCNFDSKHLQRVLDSGVPIYTNQVQFSLIDSRPTEKMGEICRSHGIKLLTYGTLCGGYLADKWLGKPEPDIYEESITPSQRKYHGIILSWGGWSLFQELLRTLYEIGKKHNVKISNVATRWVLDFDYVGAVIVGARMGVSEHTDENLASFGWSLDDQDRAAITELLAKSRRKEMFESMGDCGGEYRSLN